MEYIYDQIVIGQGISAWTFLEAAMRGSQTKFVHKKTLVIGRGAQQLWARVAAHEPLHQMGQPQGLLRPNGLAGHREGSGFTTANQFNQMLGGLRTQARTNRGADSNLDPLTYFNGEVEKISRGKTFNYRVVAHGREGTRIFFAKQVIVASGAGGGTWLEELPGVTISGDVTAARTRGDYIDAVDYMTCTQPRGKKVLVYGGSATASWAAAHAFASNAQGLMWACRQGPEQIKTAGNPIGRNQEVIDAAESGQMLWQATIKTIEIRPDISADRKRFLVTFTSLIGGGQRFVEEDHASLEFDQIVCAIGANAMEPSGPGGILDPAIQGGLEPVWDRNWRFAPMPFDAGPAHKNIEARWKDPGPIVIALKDKTGDLWVVGAAVFRGAGAKTVVDSIGNGDSNCYARIGQILAAGGRPPEGIAILDLAINALTGAGMTRDNFNWQKANRREIFGILSKTYVDSQGIGIPYWTREKLVDEIIAARARSTTGLSLLEASELMFLLVQKYKLNIDPNKLPRIVVPRTWTLKNLSGSVTIDMNMGAPLKRAS